MSKYLRHDVDESPVLQFSPKMLEDTFILLFRFGSLFLFLKKKIICQRILVREHSSLNTDIFNAKASILLKCSQKRYNHLSYFKPIVKMSIISWNHKIQSISQCATKKKWRSPHELPYYCGVEDVFRAWIIQGPMLSGAKDSSRVSHDKQVQDDERDWELLK